MKSPLSNFNDLGQRVVVALIGAVFITWAIVYDGYSAVGLFWVLLLFTQWEFYQLVRNAELRPMRYWGMAAGLALYVVLFGLRAYDWPSLALVVLVPLFFMPFLLKLWDTEDAHPFESLAFTVMGILYVAAPFSLLLVAAFTEGTYQWEGMLALIFMLWANDTGGYFAGRFLGKRKLWERISPKKTWEGSVGGALLALVVMFFFWHYTQVYSLYQWLGLWAVLVVFASLGDLVESMLKRSLQQKDSGHSLPGHGGFLDRFDGLLLAAPFWVLTLELYRYWG